MSYDMMSSIRISALPRSNQPSTLAFRALVGEPKIVCPMASIITAGFVCVYSSQIMLNYRVVGGRGSFSITATSNVRAAGIIAFNATALPTPIAKSEAVIMGEMTVAID
jgi:hypothetical protein